MNRRQWLTSSAAALGGMFAALFARRTATATDARATKGVPSVSVSSWTGFSLETFSTGGAGVAHRGYRFDPPMPCRANDGWVFPPCAPGEVVTINGETGEVVRREHTA